MVLWDAILDVDKHLYGDVATIDQTDVKPTENIDVFLLQTSIRYQFQNLRKILSLRKRTLHNRRTRKTLTTKIVFLDNDNSSHENSFKNQAV